MMKVFKDWKLHTLYVILLFANCQARGIALLKMNDNKSFQPLSKHVGLSPLSPYFFCPIILPCPILLYFSQTLCWGTSTLCSFSANDFSVFTNIFLFIFSIMFILKHAHHRIKNIMFQILLGISYLINCRVVGVIMVIVYDALYS